MTDLIPYEAETLYNDPGMPLSEEIIELTGLTDEMLAGHSISSEDVEAIFGNSEFAGAHNAKFDRSFFDVWYPDTRIIWGCSIRDIDLNRVYKTKSAILAYLMVQYFAYYMQHHDSLQDSWAGFQLVKNNFKEFVENIMSPSYKVLAHNSPFEQKEMLKTRGYRWNGDAKVWFRSIVKADVIDEEIEFLNTLSGCTGEAILNNQFDRHKETEYA